ncbi:MAG: TfoX/Sxy family protein [Anaerolineae bacterium]
MMPKPSAAHQTILDDMLLRIPGVSVRKTFGSPGYYVEGKMFACVFGDSIALKLPEATIAEVLKREDAGPFQPGGQMMMRGLGAHSPRRLQPLPRRRNAAAARWNM